MADQNKKDTDPNFYNEILTPSELFAARSRSHKIPVRGQKDFFPDGSDEQRRRLEQSLNEHWDLVSEERVEKM
ncbi:tRNA-splicing endonuclease subunit Sen54 [Liparis tanakae]|uniref:tRNA-splicing endonuclease subunit Sen54 n=1 Tax=Liparis tanakae TaxID=230148 RepID=A0A4Z2EAY5_9TELE|nr:tRNA-splicing endonuclease subunit Sen54 [Liparis tanakae]